jgi:anti-sigma regulatory factor (Ser/Thr protein kinase)
MGFMRFPRVDPPQRLELAPGDVLGLISDGVFEAADAAGQMFGTAGVENVLLGLRARPMSDVLGRLLQAVHVHAAGTPQADDITIVLIARRGEPAARTTVQQYFRRTFDSLEGVFAFVEAFLAARSLDPDLRAPVCFMVEELFTNLVKYNAASPHDIAISLGHTPRQLTVQLMDFDVEPFDVTRAPTVDTNKPLQEREPGGLGLHLVRQMADTLRYDYAERCSTITFTKALGEG